MQTDSNLGHRLGQVLSTSLVDLVESDSLSYLRLSRRYSVFPWRSSGSLFTLMLLYNLFIIPSLSFSIQGGLAWLMTISDGSRHPATLLLRISNDVAYSKAIIDGLRAVLTISNAEK